MHGGNRNPHFLLASFLPSTKIKLGYGSDISDIITRCYYYHTNPTGLRSFVCEECGMPFVNKARGHIARFCSRSCARKHTARIKRIKTQKLLFRLVDQKAFGNWFKQYNNIIVGYICNNYDSEWREDLIDRWTDKSMHWFYCCKCKDTPINFLKSCLQHEFLNLQKTKKEIFYSECNYKTQEKILGGYNNHNT